MAWKRALLSAGILLMGLVLVSGAENTQADSEGANAMWHVGNSNYMFSRSLYKVLAKTRGNIFFSPLSIHSILTMVSLGAKENTLKQLNEGLSLPDVETAKNGYRHLNKNLRFSPEKGVTVNIANKVYVSKRAQLSNAYKRMTRDYFNAASENVDFSNGEQVRNDINRWVENNTNNKITDIVPSGSLNSDTAMVLVNAVYFKGKWQTEFDPANTTIGTFNGIKGEQQLNFMQATSEFSYRPSHKLKTRVVELLYNGGKLSLVIILPTERKDFKTMERSLVTANPGDYLPGEYDKYNVKVKIPRFRLEKETPLGGALKELGMTDMFESNADLSGLSSSRVGLKVSKVLHKAFLEVNEEGSEAAATTVLAVQTLSAISDDFHPIDFIADQPFIFMIRHKASNSILFMGRYVSADDDEGVQTSLPNPASGSNQHRAPTGSRDPQKESHGYQEREEVFGDLRMHVQENREALPESQPDNGEAGLTTGAGTTSNDNVQNGKQPSLPDSTSEPDQRPTRTGSQGRHREQPGHQERESVFRRQDHGTRSQGNREARQGSLLP